MMQFIKKQKSISRFE